MHSARRPEHIECLRPNERRTPAYGSNDRWAPAVPVGHRFLVLPSATPARGLRSERRRVLPEAMQKRKLKQRLSLNSPSGGDGAAGAARVERNRDRRPPFRLGAAWRVRTRCPKHMLSAFGEPEIKSFVQASIDENLKLESSLRMLKTGRTV